MKRMRKIVATNVVASQPTGMQTAHAKIETTLKISTPKNMSAYSNLMIVDQTDCIFMNTYERLQNTRSLYFWEKLVCPPKSVMRVVPGK